MKYHYIGSGSYIVGLPACDIDEAELTNKQRELLKPQIGVLYEPEKDEGNEEGNPGNAQ